MGRVVDLLKKKIEDNDLLKHPFFVAMSHGELSLEDLEFYACQQYHQVSSFPAYLSQMHCLCADLDIRRVLAASLADEEGGAVTHMELWLDFAAGLGASKEDVLECCPLPAIESMVEVYQKAARQDIILAVAAMYCYDQQMSRLSALTLESLKKHYSIDSPAAVRYHILHEQADLERTLAWEEILESMPVDEARLAAAADRALNALWYGMDGIHASAAAQD